MYKSSLAILKQKHLDARGTSFQQEVRATDERKKEAGDMESTVSSSLATSELVEAAMLRKEVSASPIAPGFDQGQGL